MLRAETQPAAERPVVFVDGDDARAGVTEEGGVGEDQAEGGEEPREGAALGLEDFFVGAAAVEAEDAGEGERGGGCLSVGHGEGELEGEWDDDGGVVVGLSSDESAG